MNRLQKKCLIASASLHLSLVLLLGLGTAFFVADNEPQPVIEMTVIPANLVDAALFSGGTPNPAPARSQPAPAPTPATQPDPAPQPPPKPKPQRTPPKTQTPSQSEDKPEPAPAPDNSKSGDQPSKPKKSPRRIETTYSETTANSDSARNRKAAAAAAARQQERALAAQAARWRNALAKIGRDLGEGLSSGVELGPLGPGGEAFGNYRSAVFKIYYEAWRTPADVADNDSWVHARIVVARDGRVISHEITQKSGLPALDKSVEETLDRVRQLPPFPESSNDSQRSFLLQFSLKAKRQLG